MNLEELKRKLEGNGFTSEQVDEVILGIDADVDVSVYCKTVFSAAQMREIRIGLQHKLYVKDYLDPKLSSEQMWIIRHAKESGLDTGVLTGSLEQMMATFIALQNGVYSRDMSTLSADSVYELQTAVKHGIGVDSIPYKELDSCQLYEVIAALEQDLGITALLVKQADGEYMSASKMFEIRKGLEAGLNLIQECDGDGANYNASQLREIRFGLIDGVNVAVYRNKDLGSAEMRQIRLGLHAGVDVSLYSEPGKYSAAMMRVIRQGLTEGVHPVMYLTDSMTAEEAILALQSIMNARENVHDSDNSVSLNQDYLNQILGNAGHAEV